MSIDENNPRENIINIFKQKVGNQLDFKDLKDLEKGIYNWSIKFSDENEIVKNWQNSRFCNLYIHKALSVLSNVDPNSYIKNSRLIQRLKEKEFKPHEVPFMQPENIYPEIWKKTLDTNLQKEQRMFNDKPEAMTNAFKCGKCKKNECIYKEIQIRSCDEPMTLFITCLNCGNRWRI